MKEEEPLNSPLGLDRLVELASQDAMPPADRLEVLRAKVSRVRDLRAEVEDLSSRVTDANKEIQDLTFKQLPDMFEELGMRNMTLEATGNLPPYGAEKKPYFKANIAAEWPPEKRAAGLTFLEQRDAGDLIRLFITVELGRGEAETGKKIIVELQKLGVDYSVSKSVHWGTLTAWLREQVQKYKRDFTPGELDMIGAKVGTIVEVKPVKAER
jgi:hypothetical protein